MTRRRALITGITGQDGSYLARFLLSKGYEVHGMVRRSSTEKFDRIAEIKDRLTLHQGDLLDQLSLIDLLEKVGPQEVYNLAAMSFVPTSWNQPVLTAEFTAIGVTRMLEAIRTVDPKIRFYQASSSEMFGKVRETPQRETTPFYPRSPYGVAKVYGHWITVNYRESYGLFATSGILFNHESVPGWTPVLVRRDGLLDLLPIEELMPNHARLRQRTPEGMDVWEDGRFVKILKATAYPHGPSSEDKGVTEVAARCGVVDVTRDHQVYTPMGTVAAKDLQPGGAVLSTERYPEPVEFHRVTPEWAKFLGIFVGDGYAGWGDGKYEARIRSDDESFLRQTADLWRACTGGSASLSDARSGYRDAEVPNGALNLTGAPGISEWLSAACYTRARHKRVPRLILNAGLASWRSFLEGYNLADGLKAGHGKCEFRNFKTNSPTLASQLMWMAEKALEQRTILHVERVERNGEETRYLSIHLNTPTPSGKGAHLRKDRDEILHLRSQDYTGFLFDLTTESGRFAAGVGNLLIHNSPHRGLEFVTRKITHAAARIKLGLQRDLRLGNLDARRDWGFAGDYVRAMWLMLQRRKPDDFVIATGVSHSVRDFAECAFRRVGLDWRKHVKVDRRYYRPADVDVLRGDASKARRLLGWRPEVDFRGLVGMMVEADLERAGRESVENPD